MEETVFRYENNPTDLLLLARKMLSYKALMAISLILGLLFSFVWGLFIYNPSYGLSASYSFTISTDPTFKNMYGVHYLLPDEFVAKMKHKNTVEAFLSEKNISEEELSSKDFLKSFEVKYANNLLSVSVEDVKEDLVGLYKEYINSNIEAFDSEYRSVVSKELKEAKATIGEELAEVKEKTFGNDTTNASNYSYSITLSDRIKNIDIQLATIDDGAIKTFSDFDLEKKSSRAKSMIIIVLITLFAGAAADFIICFIDPQIYFSGDMTINPSIRKRIISCIPLYKDGISIKESTNIRSKLPDGTSSISVSEISPDSGAMEISKSLKSVASGLKFEYAGCLVKDGDILSSFSNYDTNLIVLRAGIDDINQVRNIVNGCRIKGVDNYYFVLYGLEPSDKMVTLFEDKSHYVKYPFYSFRTLRQHYEHYYKKG